MLGGKNIGSPKEKRKKETLKNLFFCDAVSSKMKTGSGKS